MSRAVRRVKFETISKYPEWYLCQISRTNHAIICLYYYPQKVCELEMSMDSSTSMRTKINLMTLQANCATI